MNAHVAAAARPAIFGTLAFGLLIAVYFGALAVVSGWAFTRKQTLERHKGACKMRTRLIVFFLSLTAALLAVPSAQAASSLPPQSSSQAGVTVQVTPRVVSGSTWEFEFALNTHSGDLSDDLEKAVVLVADGGTSYAPVAWQGDPPGGHHRKGVLRFKAISPQPQAIELKLQRPGEPSPRSLRWQLK